MHLAGILCSYSASWDQVGRPSLSVPYSALAILNQITTIVLYDSLHSCFVVLLNHTDLCQASSSPGHSAVGSLFFLTRCLVFCLTQTPAYCLKQYQLRVNSHNEKKGQNEALQLSVEKSASALAFAVGKIKHCQQ